MNCAIEGVYPNLKTLFSRLWFRTLLLFHFFDQIPLAFTIFINDHSPKNWKEPVDIERWVSIRFIGHYRTSFRRLILVY
ncbi:hypothetical protein L1887_06038 [Cichorium endivia]|nr:hypothetical protein L1887_06038 [Cichorium endivia]